MPLRAGAPAASRPAGVPPLTARRPLRYPVRRRSTFKALSEHLATMMTVAPCPLQHCTVEDSSTQAPEQLSVACAELQQWLTQVLLQPGAAQTPVMRNFLCAEANLPPPDLNVTWVRQSRSSLDEVCVPGVSSRAPRRAGSNLRLSLIHI